MLKQLFDPCFANLSLVRLDEKSKKDAKNAGHGSLVTFSEVVFMSKFMMFALVRGSDPQSFDILDKLKAFQTKRNLSHQRNTPQPKLKRLFGLKSAKKKNNGEFYDLSTVILDMDFHSNDYDANSVISEIDGNAIFCFAPTMSYIQKGRLLRSLKASTAPSLILVDGSTLSVLSVHCKEMLLEKNDVENFPWHDASPSSLLSGNFIRIKKNSSGDREVSVVNGLKKGVKALYFGAKWCPPCRALTNQLIDVYGKIKEKTSNFEIVFCSFDRTKESFEEYLSEMPWVGFPFDSEVTNNVRHAFDVQGIPTVVILDEDNNIITKHGKNILLSDPKCLEFPWKHKDLYELNEFTVQRITDLPTLIMFTEGTPDDSIFAKEVLKTCADILYSQLKTSISAESNLSNLESSPSISNSFSETSSITSEMPVPSYADLIQVMYTGEHPICDFILESLGLGQMELPLLVICDTLTGFMAICDKPDISDTTAVEFVNEYRSGKARVLPLPKAGPGVRNVAGIPLLQPENA
ncbi:unnamed protein product [Bursaphelenchus xylophilus]|uniref:(pine wood nematode) hypothetical protein n=1 Tax=Bursaphelenchus xylophilus TaxID=6326 RepID=A0A1I7SR41_BURXY|nr:unnamed protein product [Bursaphelenchus xylophilus]CAG9110799.1 unnamed protein product [Bursaphelenchus xylophilus]